MARKSKNAGLTHNDYIIQKILMSCPFDFKKDSDGSWHKRQKGSRGKWTPVW